MDTHELALSFTYASTLDTKINQFRNHRIESILNNETPVPLFELGKAIVHFIPFESFTNEYKFNIKTLENNANDLGLIHSSGWNPKINLDGVLLYTYDSDNKSLDYTQIFRNGIIEAVDSKCFSRSNRIIPSYIFEKSIIDFFNRALQLYTKLLVNKPLFFSLTLVDIKGYKLSFPQRCYDTETDQIPNNIIKLPETIIENETISTNKLLRPIFDIIWNACGIQSSINFDLNDVLLTP